MHSNTPAPVGSLAKIALAGSPASTPPIAFPLPARGGDRFWGLSRSTWYSLERKGVIHFLRIRLPGNIRGRVLIDYAEAAAALRRLGELKDSEADKTAAS